MMVSLQSSQSVEATEATEGVWLAVGAVGRRLKTRHASGPSTPPVDIEE